VRPARRRFAAFVASWTAGALLPRAQAQDSASLKTDDRWFTSSDGVRLHYLEAGASKPGQPTLVFVPGWTMPAWIWSLQIEYFARENRVLALDPRGQGRSTIAATGYNYRRRAADIAELLTAARCADVVLVGWSLAVLECLQYLHDAAATSAPSPVRALVLVDNSVGEGDPPSGPSNFTSRLRSKRRETVTAFVKAMFKREQPQTWLDQLTEAALRMPAASSIQLLNQGTPREFWRETLYALELPVMYAYTPRLARQGELVKANKPAVETLLFEGAGHALFVDDATVFNTTLQAFITRTRALPGVGR
jgi:non-heme chloroperoxidase